VYVRQVWFNCLGVAELNVPLPQATDQLEEWWLRVHIGLTLNKREKKKLDARVTLICWSIWKQRNARTFGNMERQFNEDVLAARIVEDMKLWSLARLGGSVGVDDPG
jgi:hypothetical protein